MEATLEVRLRYLVEDTDRHGNVRIYLRRKGSPKVRLRAKPGTTEFLDEYKRALIAAPQPLQARRIAPDSTSLRWLVEAYYRSAEFHQLGESTRRVRRLILDGICTSKTLSGALRAELRYTGVRRSDVVKLGRGMEHEGRLHFAVTKGALRKGKPGQPAPGPKRLSLPILPELRAILDATPSGHMTYLVNEWGKPFTAAGFGNKFRDWCDQAGLPHCSAHGIRKADATLAAENGATTHELMAMFGWDSIHQAEHYTRKASQARLAKGAMHKLGDHRPEQTGGENVPPAPRLKTVGHSSEN